MLATIIYLCILLIRMPGDQIVLYASIHNFSPLFRDFSLLAYLFTIIGYFFGSFGRWAWLSSCNGCGFPH